MEGMVGEQANMQRILNCDRPSSMPVRYANDEENRRITKLEAAAEMQESPSPSAIYRDCSGNNGCRSRTAVTINAHTYYASYGRTQFVVETFLSALLGSAREMSAQEMRQLGLDRQIRLPNGWPFTLGQFHQPINVAVQRFQELFAVALGQSLTIHLRPFRQELLLPLRAGRQQRPVGQRLPPQVARSARAQALQNPGTVTRQQCDAMRQFQVARLGHLSA